MFVGSIESTKGISHCENRNTMEIPLFSTRHSVRVFHSLYKVGNNAISDNFV